MNFNLIIAITAIIGFWVVMYALFGRKSEGIELEEEGLQVDLFVAMWRTKKLLNFINNLARKWRKFWKAYATIGIVIGFVGMAFVFYMLFKTAMNTLSTKAPSAGVQLVIPGVTIPLWYGLIGLVVVMVVHELSHGVVARAEKLRLKSVGLVLFAVIPGAFVEPDEDELKKAPLLSRLRVYAAGSMANIVVALLAIVLLNYALMPVLAPSGVEITNLDSSGPAKDFLMKGDIIIGINGEQIKTIEDFLNFMNKTAPGETIELEILRNGEVKHFQITLGEHPEKEGKGYLGIYPAQSLKSKIGFDSVVLPLAFSLYWIYLLNWGIGLMNLFPLIPLDGGRMLDDLLKEYLPEKVAKPISYAFIGIGLFLLMVNLFPALKGLIG
ncbi:hypothetical protein PAP_09950 [Palaeococcus pacificus DY20341]|uniref:PDZ domain-containing protein n=1 Tax=Palaeococcus pacificus DY20341 TaxID=1343739 RepID=A0A075LVJ8_9EURY|nr:site-2 protease family protein [Palaeococcus pacificus]AIF70364.1 hypothetical protein PAP_09950 [Palaeococcus pacificus DY20341]